MQHRNRHAYLLWLLPLLFMLAAFYAYPVIDLIRLSFTNASFLQPTVRYGLSSYASIFRDPDFLNTVWITLIFVFFSVILQIGIGFLLALMFDASSRLRLFGTVAARTSVLIGWAIPGVIIGIIWNLMFVETRSGILTYGLAQLGIGPVPFLSDPNVALGAAILANVWRGTAFSMILQYSALQTVPAELTEAARIDGASPVGVITRVVLPYILPIVMINLVLATINTFNTFDLIIALTKGGPGRATEVLAMSIYNNVFQNLSLGRGAAIAVVLLLLNAVMAIGYYRLLKRQGGGDL